MYTRNSLILLIAIALLLAACGRQSSPTPAPANPAPAADTGRADQLKVGLAFVESINAHDLSGWQAVLADSFSAEYAPTGPAKLDKEQARAVNQSFLTAFPDLRFTVDRTVVDGDYVVVYWTASGTQTGPLATPDGEIPPTGQKGTIAGVYTAEVKNGRIAREWTHWDQVAMLNQLGLMPAGDPAAANTEKVRAAMAFIDSFNTGDLSQWSALLADDFTAQYPPTGPAVLDKEQANLVNLSFINAFPNIHFEAQQVIVEGDWVTIHWTVTGTHSGPLLTAAGDEIPATGNEIAGSGIYLAEVRDGRIAREWTYWDQMALLTQLGLMPAP
jgi:steroid delta-isomerase-like uncharacterized protein